LRRDRRCLASLPGGLCRECSFEEHAAGALDLVEQRLLMREMSKQRGEVGEGLVKCGDVRIRLLGEVLTEPVNDCVRRFMHDDVMRKAREDDLSREVAPRVGRARAEVPEQDAVCFGAIKSVRQHHRMREDVQGANVFPWYSPLLVASSRSPPVNAPSQRRFEMLDRLGYDRVYHLLVEPRVCFDRIESSANQDLRILEIDRLVVDAVARVVVDNGNAIQQKHVAYDWARIELLVANRELHLIGALTRVKRKGLQRPGRGRTQVKEP
jgi:hypothetical protein